MSPIMLVGAGILLVGLGVGLGYLLAHTLGRREAAKASDIQNELDEYRRHVTEHFSETAEHFQALGEQYRSLYKHMATGAGALCDPAQADRMLEFPGGDMTALAETVDEPGEAPDVIKDYAPAEESEAAEAEAKAEEPEKTEASISAAAEATEAPDADQEIAEAISESAPEETERTVH